MVGFWTSSCRAIVDVSIPYSAIYSPVRNDGPMFRHQWWLCLRRCLVRYHSDPNVFGRCPRVCLCTSVKCFGTHLAHIFMKPKFVVHHFVGRTMSNLQNMCHFINSHSSNRTMSRARSVLSSLMTIDGRPAPLSCVIFVRPFFFFSFFNPFVDTTLRQYTVPVLCRKYLMDCGPWYTFRPQKPDHRTLLFFGAHRK